MPRPTLEGLQLQNTSLKQEVTDLQKKLADRERTLQHVIEVKDRAEAEIQQVHAALDGIPNCPPREYSVEVSYGTEKRDRRLLARFIGYLATR